MATNDKKKYQLDIDSQPKDKNGNPYADPSSVAEDERPYYRKDEYYKFYSSVDSDGDRLQTFEEKKATTYPSAGGLYIAEIMLLEYVSYGDYPKPSGGYPAFWWFQYGIRDIGHTLEPLAERGFIRWAAKSTLIDHLTVADLKALLGHFHLKISGAKAVLLERAHSEIREDQIPDDLLKPKYELTEKGKEELEANAYIPYMHRSHYHSYEEPYLLNVWSLNRACKGNMPSNWRDIVSTMEMKLFGENGCGGKILPDSELPVSFGGKTPQDEEYHSFKFSDTGFRLFYHNFCLLKMNEKLVPALKGYPDAETATHVLVYGYIDRDKGIMLDVIAGCREDDDGYQLFKTSTEIHSMIGVDLVEDEDVDIMDDDDGSISEMYAEKIEMLHVYDAPEEVEKTRELDFFDHIRDLYYPDAVKVWLLKNGLEPEGHHAILIGTGEDHTLVGILTEEPKQDFGCHDGDTLLLRFGKQDGEVFCAADCDRDALSLKEKKQEANLALEDALKAFHEDRNGENYSAVINLLLEKNVHITLDYHLSDDAEKVLEKAKKVGKEIGELSARDQKIFKDGVRLLPTLLESSGKAFLAIYSAEKEIPEDSEHDEKDLIPFAKAVGLALKMKDNLDGIVLNPYTSPFVIGNKDFEDIFALCKGHKEEENKSKDNDRGGDGKRETASEQSGPTVKYISGNLDAPIQLQIEKMDVFNFSLYENKVAPIRGIHLLNKTGSRVDGLKLRIASDLNFFAPFELNIGKIPPDRTVWLEDIMLPANGMYLANLTEAITATVTIQLYRGDELLDECRDEMKLLAYDQWSGDCNLLPAFIMPNHPEIIRLKKEVALYLEENGEKPSLEGYQGESHEKHNEERIRLFMKAAYSVIQSKKIYYSDPPTGFERNQRIRTCDTVLNESLGTCMDMTILYASLLEALDLYPLLFLQERHIFCGCWLKKQYSKQDIITEPREMLKLTGRENAELTFVECTTMCVNDGFSFEEAEKIAVENSIWETEEFECIIDVKAARNRGVRPIPQRVISSQGISLQIDETDYSGKEEQGQIKIIDTTARSKSGGITTKRELWEGKLLDLSQHNMLLDLPLNASVEPIMSSHIDELEDALADGHEFTLQTIPEWILSFGRTEKDKNGKETRIPWLQDAINELGVFEISQWPVVDHFDFNEQFRQEYKRHRLYTFCNEKELDRDLTGIYRTSRSSQQENGVSSLYLAIGLLRWIPDTETGEVCYAPLVLQPIEIVRKSANLGYALHVRDEEPHFNLTLLEMLKQNYNLEIGGLDPLPTDAHGTDIRKVFSIVRSAVYSIPNWDVVETAVIGNFSFAQFAMWNDIHTAGDKLDNNKIVRSLMKGQVDWDTSTPDNPDIEQTYLPITVDATQQQAIERAAQGSTFVLHGPPGTGKSQTITGMIANLLAQDKSVLFVAEKMAALSVVDRRLTGLGIGDFCIEVHSEKANKKHVLSQLEKALEAKKPENKTEYEACIQQAASSRAKLDDYSRHLHAVQPNGYTLRELIDLYETVRDAEYMIPYDSDIARTLTKTEINRHLPLIGQLTAAGSVLDANTIQQMQGVDLKSYSAEVRSSLRGCAERYAATLKKLQECSDLAEEALNIDKETETEDLFRLAALVQECGEKDPIIFSIVDCDQSEIVAYLEKDNELDQERDELLKTWKSTFLEENIKGYQERYENADRKFFGRSSAIAAVTGELQKFAVTSIQGDRIPSLLQPVVNYQKNIKELQIAYDQLSEEAKKILKNLQSDQEFKTICDDATTWARSFDEFPGGLDAAREITADKQRIGSVKLFLNAHDAMISAETALNQLLSRITVDHKGNWIEHEQEFCSFALKYPAALKEWGIYNHIRKECLAVGLNPVVEEYEKTRQTEGIESAYKKGLYYALINEVILNDDVLSSFSGATFNESVQQFKKIDAELLKVTRQEIYYKLASRIPSSWDSPEVAAELNLLRKAISSNARGMSIRTLFSRIPHVLRSLCPCMLMSPNSVAQYLAQENDLFDVVIFDEASQLPTCKAVGALYRGKNAVIVGDPKQMPPTSFFAGGGPVLEDITLDDLDSILDDALALGIPSQYLKWHYRSTHESLIAFSNNEFYDNKMFTFPSANDREQHVTSVHVKGVYKDSKNVKEAEAVVAEIVRRYRDAELRGQSIGVVTFNVKQRDLIENLLKKQYQKDQKLDAWANNSEDPLFVKNLENVQGDERDVILFSIGYGPDEKGRISMNFGPINQQGGGKRLNVAFSRARVTMTVFTSMYSTDIRVTDSSPEGMVAFRDFLKFAEGNEIRKESAEKQQAAAKAGIMQNICKAITEHGLQCEVLVGHSDFHVDIAVIDPYEPTKYLMGILLDGDGYRQTKNTRDREVAQIAVLKNLGWTIHRVWTMDWWDNRENEIRKLLFAIDKLKEKSAVKAGQTLSEEEKKHKEQKEAEAAKFLQEELESQAAEVISEEAAAERDESEKQARKNNQIPDTVEVPTEKEELAQEAISNPAEGHDYSANVATADTSSRFSALETEKPTAEEEKAEKGKPEENPKPEKTSEYVLTDYTMFEAEPEVLTATEYAASRNSKKIQERIARILEMEAPIQKDLLIQRTYKSFGLSKSNAAIEATEKALKAVKAKNNKQNGIVYCWKRDQEPNDYMLVRGGENSKNARGANEICQQEMKNAICYVLQSNGAKNKANLLKETARLLGYQRMTETVSTSIDAGIRYAKRIGAITTAAGGAFVLNRNGN